MWVFIQSRTASNEQHKNSFHAKIRKCPYTIGLKKVSYYIYVGLAKTKFLSANV